VGGREGGRLVLAAEVDELDVVADQVELAVQAEVVVADGALEAAGRGGAVDDLAGRGADAEAGGEGDQRLVALLWRGFCQFSFMAIGGSRVCSEKSREDAYLEAILAEADGDQRVSLSISDRSSKAGRSEEGSSSEESGLHFDGVDLVEWSERE
jgi:hypothetical protein